MIEQTLMFTTPVSLSLKDKQLVVTFKDNKEKVVTRPIKDIGFVVIENPMVSITVPLLNELCRSTIGGKKRRKSANRTFAIGIFLVTLCRQTLYTSHFIR